MAERRDSGTISRCTRPSAQSLVARRLWNRHSPWQKGAREDTKSQKGLITEKAKEARQRNVRRQESRMTNRQLRKVLLEKLGVTPQALSQRVKKLKKQCPMTTEHATYVIAQRECIILDKYLDEETIDHVRHLLQHLQTPPRALPPLSGLTRREKQKEEGERTIIVGKEFKVTDAILGERKISEANEMASIYPLLYILENSIRELIDRVMTCRYGNNWWDTEAPKKLVDTVTNRMADEERNSWHQRRGARPIDYLDLNQLPTLMRTIQNEVVPGIIPSLEWFTQFIEEIYKSRCVICHMNPLDRDNIQIIQVRVKQWQKHINAKKNVIPNRS